MNISFFVFGFCLVLSMMLSVGCSSSGDRPDLAPVQGMITLDGKPLEGAMISFKPNEGQPSYSRTDSSGHYELNYLRDAKGAKIGSHKVRITTASEENPEELVPKRYNRKTELTKEVESGGNEFNFELVSKTE
jgi:hypothetical protein